MPTPAGGQACLRAGSFTHCSAKGSRFVQIAESGQERGLALNYSVRPQRQVQAASRSLKNDK